MMLAAVSLLCRFGRVGTVHARRARAPHPGLLIAAGEWHERLGTVAAELVHECTLLEVAG